MKLCSKKVFFGAVGSAAISLFMIGSAATQTTPANKPATPAKKPAAQAAAKPSSTTAATTKPPAMRVGTSQSPLLSQQAFRNIQVMRNIPATEFIDTMGFFSASLVETCTYCHSEESDGSWAHYADDTNPIKLTARKMITMTDSINKQYFAGEQVVTCYSCHHGQEQPEMIPDLAAQYAVPATEDPEEIIRQDPNAPSPDQVLTKYFQAIGGETKANALTSYAAKGNYQAYSASETGTVDIYAKAPNQHNMTLHTASGDSTVIINGNTGWQSGPDETTPLPVVALAGVDLKGFKADAALAFPGQIKKALSKLRTGTPLNLDGKDYLIVEGNTADGIGVKLYFDAKSGLLLRQRRLIKTRVGLNPYQIEYSDYRDVNGLKMPFHLVITWTDGRSTIQLNQIQANVAIDASKFSQPPAPKPVAGN